MARWSTAGAGSRDCSRPTRATWPRRRFAQWPPASRTSAASSPGDSFRGWLWTITRNKIRDHFRGRHNLPAARGGSDAQQQFAQLPDLPPGSSETPEHPDDTSSLARRGMELVRAEFEDRTWRAFWRTTVDRQPAAAVADELGMTPAAVYKAKSRVLQRIRRELGDLLE